MTRKIPIHSLRVGMFLDRYGEGTFQNPETVIGRIVVRQEEIDDLKAQGVAEVWVDFAKTPGIAPPEEAPPSEHCADYLAAKERINYFEEIAIARRVYAETLSYVKTIFERIRQGLAFDYHSAEPHVREILGSLYRNDRAATSLTILRGREAYLHTHSVNVAILSATFGKYLGLTQQKVHVLAMAGLFHDIGKLKINEKILAKPGKLTVKEFQTVKRHPVEGYLLLKDMRDIPEDVLRGVLEHHERYDGSGYPQGLTGRKTSLCARIVSIVDSYDAMTSDRPHMPAVQANEALKKMYSIKDSAFYPQFLEQFIKCMGIYPVGCFVRLSDGRYAVVTDISADAPLHPTVKVIFDTKMRPVHPEILDLATPGKLLPKPLLVSECVNPRDHRIDLDLFLA